MQCNSATAVCKNCKCYGYLNIWAKRWWCHDAERHLTCLNTVWNRVNHLLSNDVANLIIADLLHMYYRYRWCTFHSRWRLGISSPRNCGVVECNRPLRGFVFALCWQGVTLTDLKEAEKTVAKTADTPPRNIQPVSPIVSVTPAERGEWRWNAPKYIDHRFKIWQMSLLSVKVANRVMMVTNKVWPILSTHCIFSSLYHCCIVFCI